ncbi:MAG: RND transporter [Nitrosomonas sp.]|nr:MAG: RND transporter [Nitrosomonas sp.]
MSIFQNNKFIIILVLIVCAGAYWLTNQSTEASVEQFKIRAVDRGDIVQTISANGTLAPVVVVNVGTQVSGTVSKLYADFNDEVETGQILAELDPALLNAQLQQSEANLLSDQVSLKIAKNKLKRNQLLKEKGFISEEALEIVVQELDAARAQYAVSKAQVERDRANLDYSIIKSPISGVVIDRDVDVGQTVAANFQTPILFQIAKDLSQMQINISVAEADIGLLQIDQQINFTVDAFPERNYTGIVKQVRLNPTIQENVVTYNVVAMVNNDDGSLLPGMTANIRFVINQKNAVLRAPNAALRYKPKKPDEIDRSAIEPGIPVIYQLKHGKPVPINVNTGITDGKFTEIIDGQVAEGDKLIVGETSSQSESSSKFRFRMF